MNSDSQLENTIYSYFSKCIIIYEIITFSIDILILAVLIFLILLFNSFNLIYISLLIIKVF